MLRSSGLFWFSTMFLRMLFIMSSESELRVFSLSNSTVPTPSCWVKVDNVLLPIATPSWHSNRKDLVEVDSIFRSIPV
uniref:Putative secreted protein n=1 Tax=Anopheles triannulatus TaxID=58253 RepID=A0A2M4B5P1_9DIPT